MNWTKGNRWYIQSDTKHSVSFAYVRSQPKYHAWSPKKEPLGVYDDLEQAQQRREEHHINSGANQWA